MDWGLTTFNVLGIQFSINRSEITGIDFRLQISKTIVLIEQWKRLILTPFDSITVNHSLFIPKLIILSLYFPSESNEGDNWVYM